VRSILATSLRTKANSLFIESGSTTSSGPPKGVYA
jgi:hypothetical protein